MQFDPSQRAVINWSVGQGNLRVIGGAGSGKTGTLVYMVAKQILVDQVPPDRVCVFAFNRNAGRELRHRLRPLVGDDRLVQMTVGTFHAVGLQTLRKHDPGKWEMDRCIDMPQATRSFGVPSKHMLWRRAVVFGSMPGTGVGSLKVAEVGDYHMNEVSLLRSRGVRAAAAEGSRYCRRLPTAWRMVEAAKKALEIWDFDDVMDSWYDILKTRPEGWYDLVVVDESQDNTKIRLDIARALAGQNGRIVLVGDSRQTIYVWAGAYPELFRDADTVLDAQTMALQFNYRSAPEIVDLANRYAQDKSWSMGGQQEAAREPGEGLRPVVERRTAEDQFRAWAAEVQGDNEDHPVRSRAVLLRTNGLVAHCESVFRMKGIPVRVHGGKPVLETSEGKVVLDYIKSVWEDDIDALSRVINRPNRFIPRSFTNQMERLNVPPDTRVEDVIRSEISRSRMSKRSKKGLYEFCRFLSSVRKAPWEEALDMLCDNIVGGWKDTGEAHVTDSIPVIHVAFGLAQKFEDFDAFMQFADPKRRPPERVMPPVTLSTIHRAKGMEWDMVFMDVTDGYLPFYKSLDATERREEEERLIYVGITRAKDVLVLGAFEQDPNDEIPGGMSRFLTDHVAVKRIRGEGEDEEEFPGSGQSIPLEEAAGEVVKDDKRPDDGEVEDNFFSLVQGAVDAARAVGAAQSGEKWPTHGDVLPGMEFGPK